MQEQQAAGIGNPYVCGGGVNVIANPSGGQTDSEVLTSNRAGGIGIVHAPPHVVPVETSSSNNETVTVTEAPPVTELVTESPLENGLSASNIGVIGGNKIHFPPPSLPSKLLYSLHSSFLSMLVRAYGHFSLLTKDFLDDVRSSTDYIVVPCSIKYEPGENCVVWLCYCSISITRMGVVAKKKKKRRPCSYIPPYPCCCCCPSRSRNNHHNGCVREEKRAKDATKNELERHFSSLESISRLLLLFCAAQKPISITQ